MNVLRYPPNVQWEVTAECNHNCIHCYNYWRKDYEKFIGMKKSNSEKEYLQLANKIIEQKPVSVVITGGEPLLVFNKIKSSIDLLLKNGICVSINTNITMLDTSIIEYLKKNKIGLFVSFPCSNLNICDEITNIKNSSINIIKKLDLAYKNNISFMINMVISKINLNYLEESVFFLKNRYNISKISITRVGKPINSSETFNKYLLDAEDIKKLQEISVKINNIQHIKVETSCPYTACSIYSDEAFQLFAYNKICTAGKTSYAIDTEGNVKACPRDNHIYGNILKSDFKSIWDLMYKWRDNSYIPEECKKCHVLKKCLGGCRVDSFPFTGVLNHLDTISNIENIPIKFEKKVNKSNKFYDRCDNFIVSNKICCINENDFIRVSVGRMYIFLTKALYNFISNNSSFTLKKLMDIFNVDYSTANNVIRILILNNIVYKS